MVSGGSSGAGKVAGRPGNTITKNTGKHQPENTNDQHFLFFGCPAVAHTYCSTDILFIGINCAVSKCTALHKKKALKLYIKKKALKLYI